MEQPQYNLFHRERVEVEYAALYERFGLGTTIWSPLASGILSGKYLQGMPQDARANLPGYEWLKKIFESPEGQHKINLSRELHLLAQELHCTLPQLSIAWCLKNPHVSTVILGASRVEQLQENLKALEVLPLLSPTIQERIESLMNNRPPRPVDYLKM